MDNSLLFATLFRKYLDNSCSPEEVDQLMALLQDDAYKHHADELIGLQVAAPTDDHRPVDRALRERLALRLQAILEAEAPAIPVYRRPFLQRNRWWLAAAAIMLLLGTGAYLLLKRPPETSLVQEATNPPESQVKQDVMPGGNKAVLTLGNGSTIILDSAANGTLAQQGNARVLKLNDGQLEYRSTNPGGPGQADNRQAAIAYNLLTTPRGGQYQLVLPDGSKVWLNAASSIRYPTAFTGNERIVTITGEVYFEVAKNAAMPFSVKTNSGAIVQVLGTHFNINAYDDEEMIKTTLLEGSVKVSKEAISAILKPGQQASLSQASPAQPDGGSGRQKSHTIPVQTVDVEEVMAWKNGAFQFAGADIQTVMRQISRWYDVDVEYKGNFNLHFAGTMSRNVNISQVLEMLERAGGIKTAVTGRKITIMP